jgi:hypothetical protein
MSSLITEAFVQEFSSNIYMLSQQKGSKLRACVRTETIKGKAKAFDRIGAVGAVLKSGRHSNTPQIDTPHSRRWCYLADYEWADLIDDQDKVRVLNEPTSEYLMAAMWAMGRSMDDVIIAAADATVTTGEDQGSTATHPNTQKYACNDGAALSNLNVNSLIGIKSLFGAADVDDSIQLHIAVQQSQLDSMLRDTKVTSGDYNVVRALVKGEVDTFMGFKFHRLQRLGTQGSTSRCNVVTTGVVGAGAGDVNGYRKCIAWAQDGLILGIGVDIKTRVSERDDKSYAVQPYACMALGAVRMEEEKVVIAFAKET